MIHRVTEAINSFKDDYTRMPDNAEMRATANHIKERC